MICSDRFCKGILSFWCIIYTYSVAAARRYDKCTTQDGRQGVCVVKRYCREATNHLLLPCEGDDENHCCPIPTTLRSAEPSRQPEQSWDSTGRPRTEQDHRRPDSTRPQDKPKREDERRTEIRGQDRPRHDPEKPWQGDRPRIEDDDRDIRRSEIPRERDKPRYDERPRIRDEERDKRRPELPKDDFDDRLNKTPPPGDRRSPTRHQSHRPKNPDWDRPQDDIIEKEKRRPPKNPGYPPPEHRQRNEDSESRRPSNRPVDQDRFYPNRDELDAHRHPDPPRRVDKKNDSHDWSKAPIRFPDTYELSVPRPKVPACGVKPYELFIAGGSESEENEWPWMTAIFRRHPDSRPKTFLCGGSLINTKYVLTAAHCFVNNYVILPASAFVVRLGSHFLDSGEEYTVSNLVIHHNHSGSDFFNDIALVRLASEVYITDKIAPVCLPYPEMMQDDMVGRMATVAGWGDTSFRSSGARILQHVTVPIVSGEECFSAYSRVRGAAFLARGSDHVICAGLREGGKDACLGDSGGPLMLKMADDRWVVVGIVSLGYKCAEPGYPGVYTRITHYMSWINTNMKRH